MSQPITVVGAGFAGVEAAWAIAQRGQKVRLFEMRPEAQTPAHTTGWYAELVCSNSFKSKNPESPAGQLKAEMLALGSVVLETALEHEVPGGQALAVDRDRFAEAITRKINEHPLIDVCKRVFTRQDAIETLQTGKLVLATGPLTTDDLSTWLAELTGRQHLYFYDAVSPTVEAESLDMSIVFGQSRYDKGEGDDYLNCPFDKETYDAFVTELVKAERAPIHAFEAGGRRSEPPLLSGGEGAGGEGSETSPLLGERGQGERGHPGIDIQSAEMNSSSEGSELETALIEKIKYFSGCMPIEAIAEKGHDSLRYGNFKPVGLTDPRTGRWPYAALQLRPENREKTLYSLVACQNRLKWGEQKRVFQMVPGLANAEFIRFGVIHRNTYLDAPKALTPHLQIQGHPNLYIAGQLTGVEGYVESAAFGILAGLNALREDLPLPPRETAYGSLLSHLTDQTPREFAPMNINWGLLPEPAGFTEKRKKDKGLIRAAKIEQARTAFAAWEATLA